TLTGQRSLGMITPIGGSAFIAGWFCLAMAARGINR
ncbi:membrane protein, partial [Candidatus Endoriftia persephone str. Guaymas]|nr:membrane protein [Candidatus Endoriftia persephone str. Guaymas]